MLMQFLREEPKAKNSSIVVTATLGEIYLTQITRGFCSKDITLHFLWHEEKFNGENSFRFTFFKLTGFWGKKQSKTMPTK